MLSISSLVIEGNHGRQRGPFHSVISGGPAAKQPCGGACWHCPVPWTILLCAPVRVHVGARPAAAAQVLLGWAGASDRPLAKFAEMLAEEGLISVRGVQPISYLFAPVELWRRRWALALLAFLEEQRLSPPRCERGRTCCSCIAAWASQPSLSCLSCQSRTVF